MVAQGLTGVVAGVFVDAGVAQVGVVAYLCGGFGHEGGLQQEVEGGFFAVVEGVCDEPGGAVGNGGLTGRQVVEGEAVVVHTGDSC